jgi:F-box interacting protein
MSCPFDSLNLHSNFDSKSTQLDYSPIISTYRDGLVACCDGILCFAIDERLVVLYNPCIRKLHKLPCIDLPQVEDSTTHYAFGYDPFIDNYKVVAVFNSYETQVEVHSYNLCTDSWKRIKDFPSGFYLNSDGTKHGTFMGDTVNWLTHSESTNSDAIVSLHLGKETYQEISLPDLRGESFKMLSLYVMRDCLCLFHITKERKSDSFTDVWLMKEYGNKESWIKLFRIPSFGRHAFNTDIVYISEDDNHVLVLSIENYYFSWVVYDIKNGTHENSKIQDSLGMVKSKVYIESLISP